MINDLFEPPPTWWAIICEIAADARDWLKVSQ